MAVRSRRVPIDSEYHSELNDYVQEVNLSGSFLLRGYGLGLGGPTTGHRNNGAAKATHTVVV